MPFNASSDACSSDIVIGLAEPLRVLSPPVSGAAVSGVCVAVVAAALIYMCYRKRVTITAPLRVVRRRLEVCEQNSDCDSESRRSQHKTEADKADDPQLTVNSDVAAFALKARVVYPISQRFRPLADGASNPSLHDKCLTSHNQDSVSSSDDDWPSQEKEDDDESSQFMSCTLTKTQSSHQFRRVQHYPQTLAHSRSSLLCLTLLELHLHTAQLQQEKYKIFLQILRVLLRDREHADIICAEQQQFIFTQHASVQEVEVLKREMLEDERLKSDTLMCSIEEMEKTGRQKLIRSLQTALSFAKQLERLCQSLHSRLSSDDAQEVMRTLMKGLRLVETVFAEIQSSVLKMLMDRFEWWEEVSDWLREKTTLLKKEAEVAVKLTGQLMEQLRSDGQLEKLMSEFQTRVAEELQRSIDEMGRQTDELSHKHCEKMCMRRKRMMKTQSSDSTLSHTHTDIHHMLQMLVDVQVTRWNQWRDFELQQDARITDALCERWKSLCGKCSRRLTDLSTECVESNTPASPDLVQSLLKTLELTATNQMQREERHAHTHLQMLREELQTCRQVWIEEEALTLCCLNHFGEQQHKIVMTTVSRHSDQISCAVIEEQQHLLILEFQRILAARYFYLRTVREMHSDAQDEETLPREAAQDLYHEQLAELETAADMLQEHAHFLFGHALARTARLQMSCLYDGDAVRTDTCVKDGLIDAVCESVFVTRDSVVSLICEYYTRIQHVTMQLRPHTSASVTDRRTCTRALHTQLNNCARKLNSTESLHRIVELKTKCLSEFENKHHDPVRTHKYRKELADEEKAFMCRLAALARVSLDSISTQYFTGADVRERNMHSDQS